VVNYYLERQRSSSHASERLRKTAAEGGKSLQDPWR
jgi:hypothetical protein